MFYSELFLPIFSPQEVKNVFNATIEATTFSEMHQNVANFPREELQFKLGKEWYRRDVRGVVDNRMFPVQLNHFFPTRILFTRFQSDVTDQFINVRLTSENIRSQIWKHC